LANNFLFKGELEGFENAYMVEVKIDDPVKHIKDGDEFFIIHQSINEYQSNAVNKWDKEWAIIHKSVFKNLADADEKRFETLLKKYFETEKIAEKKERNNEGLQETRRKKF
jgi:hypothetical protein